MAAYTLNSSIYLKNSEASHNIQVSQGILFLYLPRKSSGFVPIRNNSACCYKIPAPAVLTIITSKPAPTQNNGTSPKLETHILSSLSLCRLPKQ